MVEGGGDEAGSLGFSQIKYVYRYGQSNLRCEALEAYNLYHPVESLKAMIAFVSATPTAANRNCTSSFYHGFAENGRWTQLSNERGNLRGYFDVNGNVQPITGARTDDAYERLMKSLAGYNGMTHLNAYIWPNVLQMGHTMEMSDASSNRRYAMDIRGRFGLEGRTYVWHGGTYDDEMPLLTEDGTPQLDENGERILDPRAGQDWCFAFGESEWMGGISFEVAFNTARGDALAEPPVPAVGRINCITGENIDD